MNTEFEAKKPEEEKKDEETCPECGKPLAECECEKEKKFSVDTEEEVSTEPEVEKPVVVEEPAAAEEFAAQICPKCGKPVDECECEDEDEDEKDKYVLDEIPEYMELRDKYAALENNYNELIAANDALKATNAELIEFKASIEKKEKQAMIDSFYMLSDEDKKDVNDNIDTYSLEDIEAKLSIICVRNKVNFNLDDNKEDKADPTVYNLNDSETEENLVPAWIKALQSNAK